MALWWKHTWGRLWSGRWRHAWSCRLLVDVHGAWRARLLVDIHGDGWNLQRLREFRLVCAVRAGSPVLRSAGGCRDPPPSTACSVTHSPPRPSPRRAAPPLARLRAPRAPCRRRRFHRSTRGVWAAARDSRAARTVCSASPSHLVPNTRGHRTLRVYFCDRTSPAPI